MIQRGNMHANIYIILLADAAKHLSIQSHATSIKCLSLQAFSFYSSEVQSTLEYIINLFYEQK